MSEVLKLLDKLQDKKIIEVICGGMNGTVIVLVAENQIAFEIDCVWRLNIENRTLASWDEDHNRFSNFTTQLRQLEGDRVKEIILSRFLDLHIIFYSKKELFVLCDINEYYDPDYLDYNWIICDRKENYCISINRSLKEDFSVYDTDRP